MTESKVGKPVTGEETIMSLEGQWHKIAMMIMRKHGLSEIIIKPNDFTELINPGECLLVQDTEEGLHINIVSPADAVLAQAKTGRHQ